MDKPRVLLDAPVVPIAMSWEGYEVWPCNDCLPWHAEVSRDLETGEPALVEWHAIDCPFVHEVGL